MFRRVHTGSASRPAMGTAGSSLVVKQPGREAENSPPSHADIKSEWRSLPPPSLSPHVFYRHSLPFYYTLACAFTIILEQGSINMLIHASRINELSSVMTTPLFSVQV